MRARRDATTRSRRWAEPLAPGGALVAVTVALAALLARWRDPHGAMQPDHATMAPVTALAVLCAATALFLLLRHRGSGVARMLARLSAALTLLVGAGALVLHLGPGLATAPSGEWWSFKPSPLTATGVALAGLSLLALAAPQGGAGRLAGAAATGVLAVALTGLVGHLYGASTLYRADPWSATALSTVAALAALGLGVLFADGSRGVALLAVSDTSGGRLLRRLVPAAVLAPVVLGWATLALQSTLHLRQGIATALLVVALIVLLLGLVVRLAAALHALDEERERRAAGERAALQRVTESEQRYRLLTDLIPQHIWTTDAEGYHTWFSRRWYEFTGMDHRESEGQGWATRLHPADRERTLARWRHSLQTGEPYAIEYRFLGASGRYHWFLGQALPVRDASGRIVEWFGTLTDISDIRRLTESRASLMRGFGHDVRNALGTAHLQADMLDRGLLPGEVSAAQRQSIAVIRRSIRHALRMSDDLLELAQAEAGQLPLAREPTSLQGLVAEVMGDFQQQARAAGLAVQYHVPVDALAMVDPARLRQILGNLLTNAAKYAPNGRLDVIVESPATGGPRGGDWVAIRVSDTGPGIPPDQVEAIFHEGVRLAPIAVEGTGIGLAISRTLARLMGGDLTVASEPGRGSTFTLWLPPASRLH